MAWGCLWDSNEIFRRKSRLNNGSSLRMCEENDADGPIRGEWKRCTKWNKRSKRK